MRNVLLIAAREAHSLFATPTAWVLATFYQVLGGLLFSRLLITARYAELSSFYGLLGGLLLLVIPILTMGRLAGERRAGTMELLLTSPLAPWQLVWGKWLAAGLFVALLSTLTLQYPLVLSAYANPDPGQWAPATLGLALLGGLLAAIGLFTSSLTSNSVLAGMTGLALSMFLWWFSSFGSILGMEEWTLWHGASLYQRVFALHRGVLDSRDLFYFAAMTAFFLGLAARGVESDRW